MDQQKPAPLDAGKTTEPASTPESEKPLATLPDATPKRSLNVRLLFAIAAGLVILMILLSLSMILLGKKESTSKSQTTPTLSVTKDTAADTASKAAGPLKLDPAKNYGDKYADGILPVGDKQYSTDNAIKGKVFLCKANFVPEDQAGAQVRGPWFVGTTQWDINKKVSVSGAVRWDQQISIVIKDGSRVITTNDLPDHETGQFPVAANDPAAKYDRNPNTIKGQDLTYKLAAAPIFGDPTCMGGESGVMLTGVAMFNAFDAGGRDAGAWEVQDACEGHPQGSGLYHYHTLSSCIKDVSVSQVIGYALDGFPITGPKVGDKNYLTTNDLDECHGITSDLMLDGKKQTTYHYVMTQDFPYSVSCFRAAPIQAPGQHTQNSQPGSPQAGLPPKQ